MPLPKPKSGEKKGTFIIRCINDEVMKREYPERDQRVAVCYAIYKEES